MKRAQSITLAATLAVGTFSASLPAAPPVPTRPRTWQLDFQFHDPQRIAVIPPGDSEPTVYWYLLYQVINNTGQDVGFYPEFRLVTNTLEVVHGGDRVNPAVYDAIAARHKLEFPFLKPPAKTTGLMLQGEENARAGAAVFRNFDPQADSFTIYISGLSGDVRTIVNPGFDPNRPDSEENASSFVLRRTLAIEYDLPGDASSFATAQAVRRSRYWVMR